MAELRDLPKIDDLIRTEKLVAYPDAVKVVAAREAVAELRGKIVEGIEVEIGTAGDIAARIAEDLTRLSLRPVVNLSGVVLHTGLGRARLAPSVARHVAEIAAGHALVEFDDDTGQRGDRQSHVRDQLMKLTGAESALVVNNAAAALVLSLATLARDRDVVLSRGEMVEIGGSFRIPEIVAESGCRLVEVGCTNRTRLADYEAVLTPDTGALLRCHRSNYRIVGFTGEPELRELADLAREHEVPLVDDMGTGCMIDLATYGLPKTWTMADSIAHGANVVIGSGDKLLGGPQAGLIVGKVELIERIRKHPLARAFRVDKLTLAALQATLQLYVEGREQEIPTLHYLSRSLDEVKGLARRLAKLIGPSAVLDKSASQIGGGAQPGTEIPTWRVGILVDDVVDIARKLRQTNPGIIARIEKDTLWLDPRTVEKGEIQWVGETVRRCLS